MPSQEGTKKKAWGFSLWVSSLSLKALPGVTSSEADPFLPWHPLCHTRLCHVLIPYGVGTGKAALQDTAWNEVFRPAWPSRHPENPSGRSQEDGEPEAAGGRTAPSTAHAPPPAATREGPAPPQVSRRRRLCDVVPEAARAARGGSRSRLPFAAGPPLEELTYWSFPVSLRFCQNTGVKRRRQDIAPGSPQFWDVCTSPCTSRGPDRERGKARCPGQLLAPPVWAQCLPPDVLVTHVDRAGEGQCGVWGAPALPPEDRSDAEGLFPWHRTRENVASLPTTLPVLVAVRSAGAQLRGEGGRVQGAHGGIAVRSTKMQKGTVHGASGPTSLSTHGGLDSRRVPDGGEVSEVRGRRGPVQGRAFLPGPPVRERGLRLLFL
ncbi:uncharacterized protein LOC123593576 [Leopardus geoffroyi]|uniref:uncharacterized protein LOC123593576 n=1 Tax=Leopardus geoffroyi TaxID=46844 RepID=UPI001E25DD8B|nr:uncharacterized protein LOC123593576 [Leopardus geoffroyi]